MSDVDKQNRTSYRRTGGKRLRTIAWLSELLLTADITLARFADAYVSVPGMPRREMLYRWRSGAVLATRTVINRIERHFPGTADIYGLPFFEALDIQPLTRRRLGELREVNAKHIDSGAGLGYLLGHLTESLLCIRLAAADNDADQFIDSLIRFANMLPAIAGRVPWLRENLDFVVEDMEAHIAAIPSKRLHPRVEWRRVMVRADEIHFILNGLPASRKLNMQLGVFGASCRIVWISGANNRDDCMIDDTVFCSENPIRLGE